MAGAGYKLFNTGDVLTAAQVNTYLQEQVVMVFADATARTAALSGVISEGMVTYLKDTNSTEVYDGAAWVAIGSSGDITGVTAGTGISGGGTSGTVTITNSMATAIDAKGDLVVGTGADTFSRLAVGTNNQVLIADSSTATGLKWGASSGSGWTLLSTTNLVGTTNATISSISGGYKSLRARIYGVYDSSDAYQFQIQINGDTANSYRLTYILTASATVTNQAAQATWDLGQIPAGAGQNFWADITFPFYTRTDVQKSFIGMSGVSGGNVRHIWGSNTSSTVRAAAITSLKVINSGGGTFQSGSTVELYGEN
jgi:hypothetical protein